uniref:Sulfhydryl oxidase n=1 Tax=Sphenodon punctatus TaxID=8508 RepID=A0A8D0HGC3_SPHPU
MAKRRSCSELLQAALLLAASAFSGAPALSLYSPSDPLTVLQADTLERSIFNSSSAWVVEFYASWCGHCIHFAPTWRALANDIQEWRPALRLGVLDCAEASSQKVCSEFGITGFPTLKVKGMDGAGIQILAHSEATLQPLRHSIITSVERHEDVWPPACPPLEPTSLAEVRGFFQANNVTYLALIFEKADSFMGREVILDMLQYENIAVRRVLSSDEEMVKKYDVATFPSAYLLTSNGSCSRIPVHLEERSFYTFFLRRLPDIVRGTSYNLTVIPDTEPRTTPTPWRVADSSKLYMADLESVLHYTLRVEVARFSDLRGERLTALKRYVSVLAKYFPARPSVRNVLRNLNRWLRGVKERDLPYSAVEAVPNARLMNRTIWVGCQGSQSQFRGYPCSLWLLFHLLTVQATLPKGQNASPLEVLSAMREYVRFFFGCRDCAEHFEGMAAESMDKVKSRDEAVVWLWSRHNRVNARIAGTTSEDPKFPKLQWPPPSMCPACHKKFNGQQVWDEGAVLSFFKAHFSPSNIYLDYIPPEEVRSARRGRNTEEKEGVTDGKQEDGREAEEEGEERTGRPEGGTVESEIRGSERRTSPDLHRPSIVKMNPRTRELEEGIVDLDSFSEQHYRSKALKAAAASKSRRLSKRDTMLQLMADDHHQASDYDAAWERLRRKGLDGQQLLSAMGEEEGGTLRNQWFRILGVGFSRLDVSLCIVLYFLSSMCLLGMYTFFRMHMRYRKGRPGFPTA